MVTEQINDNEQLGYYLDFDYDGHYTIRYKQLKQFIKNFKLHYYIDFENNQYQDTKHPHTCHFSHDEPEDHRKAKIKIFNIFDDSKNNNYLILTEIPTRRKINNNDLNYQFDCLVINIKNLKLFFKHCEDRMFDKLDQKLLPSIDHDLMFIIELDGKSHSATKDEKRDNFHLYHYGIVTIRFKVKELIRCGMNKLDKKRFEKHTNVRRLLDDDNLDPEAPKYENIKLEDIIKISRTVHKEHYEHLI